MIRPTCVNGRWNCETVPCQAPAQKGAIPRQWAEEAYREYAFQYGSSQSFECLNERGGFSSDEIICLLFDRLRRVQCANTILPQICVPIGGQSRDAIVRFREKHGYGADVSDGEVIRYIVIAHLMGEGLLK